MIKYRGGKSRELDHFKCWIPREYDRYVEPFFGGGSLYFDIEPERAIINDLNQKLMEFYNDVAENFEQLSQELSDLEKIYARNRKIYETEKENNPNDRVDDPNEYLYYELRDQYNKITPNTYLRGTLYYFINKTSYSGMIRFNKKGEFNVPYGRYKNLNTSKVTLGHSLLLRKSYRGNGDFSDIFGMCNDNDFVFLDPPYDSVFSDYGNVETIDGFSEQNHRRLADDFFNLPCKALMVIGSTALTEELYRDYVVERYDKQYSVNIRNRFKSNSEHIVVLNRKVNLWR